MTYARTNSTAEPRRSPLRCPNFTYVRYSTCFRISILTPRTLYGKYQKISAAKGPVEALKSALKCTSNPG